MSLNSTIRSAIMPLVSLCVPDLYTPRKAPAASEYCTFQYSELPACFGDDAPASIRYLGQLHWYLPWKDKKGAAINPLPKKKKIRQALFHAGCTFPDVTNASDEVSQHYVFEFEYIEGVDEDG